MTAFQNCFQGTTVTTANTGASTAFNLDFTTAANNIRPGDMVVTNRDLQIEAFDTTAGTTASSYRFNLSTVDQTASFGISDFNTGGGFSAYGSLRNALMEIFKKVPKDLVKTEDDKKLVKAKEKSEKLLKSWLSPKEYQGLLNEGQIEVPSEFDEDTIFIIKRDPNEMVQVKKKGLYTHKLCAVADNLEMPVGDQLLSKLLLLKTDEKKFKEIAIQH